jgi:octaprenyl-diphosphate synthase
VHDPDTSEDDYQQVIYRKTAKLFEAGAQIAAVLADRDPADEASMIRYGQDLGTAFQLIDDALDYSASADELGKNLGVKQMDNIQEIIRSTGALEYTMKKARDAADSAIAQLTGIPDSEYRQALISLAEFAVQRRS